MTQWKAKTMKSVCYLVMVLALAPEIKCSLVSLRNYKIEITQIHNFYRCLERSSNMRLMTWDNYLARRAGQWSEKCLWAHQKKGLGENLSYFWSTYPLKSKDVILKSIKGWWKEKYIWRWSTNCGQACHYTQVVWAKTTKIGCTLSQCRYLRTTGRPVRNAYYFVCFYSPPGNYYGQYPYIYGSRCQKCDRSDVCRMGLCSSKYRQDHYKYLPYHRISAMKV